MNSSDEEVEISILSRYRLLVLLGKGAYGIVWKAEEKATGTTVALKKIIGAFNNDVDSQRTYREVFLLQSIRHVNIVKLLNVHRAKNDYDLYLVFEYVHTDACQSIYEKVLGDNHRVYICFQLFSALLFLESLGIVHRDLKPANILLNSDCEVKIADFGLARTVAPKEGNHLPVMTEYVATKLYRAPEIMLGSTQYSYPADIWSVGCIMAEMYTPQPKMLLYSNNIVEQLERYFSIFGKPSEEDLNSISISPALAILKQIAPTSKISLSSILQRNDKDLIDLITRCLEFNPSKRITPSEAIDHPFFKNSPIASQLSQIVLYKSQDPLTPILREEVRLSSFQYRNELYRMILEKKSELFEKRFGSKKCTPTFTSC